MLIAALAAASVALPPAMPPARTLFGVRVSWPLKAANTTVEPGTTLTVRVASSKRRSQLTFARVDASGRSIRVLARRTLRTGTFSVKVPAATVQARYALRIEVAGRKRWSWITTSAPSPAPSPVAVVPQTVAAATPTGASLGICGGVADRPYSAFKGAIQLAATQVQAGQSLGYTLNNIGQYELLDNESHELAPDPPVLYGYGNGSKYTRIEAGSSAVHTAAIPADTPPGRYRIVHSITVNAACDALAPVLVLSEPFDVLAP